VIVSTNQGPQECIELTEREVFIVSTNQSERTVAQDKIDKLSTLNGRPKAKSPASTGSHRRRKDRHEMRGHNDDDDCTTPTSTRMSSSKLMTSPKPPRRPHTSGGIRESSSPPLTNGHSHRNSFSPFPSPARLSSSPPTAPTTVPRLKPINTSIPSTSTYVTLNSPPPVGKLIPSMFSASSAAEDLVRDWEEELERIQSQSSRRSAEMLRFGRRALPPPREPPPLPPMSMRPGARAVQAVEAS